MHSLPGFRDNLRENLLERWLKTRKLKKKLRNKNELMLKKDKKNLNERDVTLVRGKDLSQP